MTRRHLCQQGGAQFVRLLALARGFLHLGLDGAVVWVRVGAGAAAHEADTSGHVLLITGWASKPG